MMQPINRNPMLLAQVAEPATRADSQVAVDLVETLRANQDRCVGMAANMIGVNKNMIVVQMGAMPYVMINPVIVRKQDPFRTQEGCLSLDGERSTKRYRKIRVRYADQTFVEREMDFTDFTAQIIQHEMDHCQGILI